MSKNRVVLLLSYCAGFQLKRLIYLADVSPVSTPEQRNKIERLVIRVSFVTFTAWPSYLSQAGFYFYWLYANG